VKFKRLDEPLLLQPGAVVFHVRDTLALKLPQDSSEEATRDLSHLKISVASTLP